MKLEVDAKRCEGHGLCLQAAPQVLHHKENAEVVVDGEVLAGDALEQAQAVASTAAQAAKIDVDCGAGGFITPETDTSIWYFWGMARNFKPHDKALTASIREGQGKIFGEDLEMLERQQQNLLAHPARQLLKLNIDSGGVQSRRVLDRILAAETGA